MVPAEGGPKNSEASILLAPKAPKQNFGCQPQTLEGEAAMGQVAMSALGSGRACSPRPSPPTVHCLEGEEGGGVQGVGYPPSSYGVRPF